MNTIDRITYCLSLPFTRSKAEELDEYVCCLEATGHCPLLKMKRRKIKALSIPIAALSRNDPSYCLYIAQLLLSDDPKYYGFKIVPQPYDGRHRRCVAKVLRIKLFGKVLRETEENQA